MTHRTNKIIFNYISEDDIEFLATDELITVLPCEQIPGFTLLGVIDHENLAVISLFGRAYGPFETLRRTQVPLWVALKWFQAGLVRIITPEWLSIDNLEKVIHFERNNPENFSGLLPIHWFQIYKLFKEREVELNVDEKVVEKIKTLLAEIIVVRKEKVKASVTSSEIHHRELNNVGVTEVNMIREGLTHMFKLFDVRGEPYAEDELT
ncbi:hypothetical protein G9A89_013429 [Geosiphon pyriformis]|nr:hypothetical protein G9A89_013429 [Geosiphon pyriformis]